MSIETREFLLDTLTELQKELPLVLEVPILPVVSVDDADMSSNIGIACNPDINNRVNHKLTEIRIKKSQLKRWLEISDQSPIKRTMTKWEIIRNMAHEYYHQYQLKNYPNSLIKELRSFDEYLPYTKAYGSRGELGASMFETGFILAKETTGVLDMLGKLREVAVASIDLYTHERQYHLNRMVYDHIPEIEERNEAGFTNPIE